MRSDSFAEAERCIRTVTYNEFRHDMRINDHIFIGIKGHAVCIDVRDGTEKWRTKLKNSSVTPVVEIGKIVVAYAGGHLFGLDRDSGRILWENKLPGLGHGYCLITGDSGQQAAAAIAQAIATSQAAASGAAAS